MHLATGVAIFAVIPAAVAFQAPRNIHVLGKVLLEGGFPPPDAVTVEISCSGSGGGGDLAGARTHTDQKGRFSIDLGGPNLSMDASAPSGTMRAGNRAQLGIPRASDLVGCELRASLTGYRAEPVQLVARQEFDAPDVGTMILHRVADIEGHTVSMTGIEAPKDARKAYEKGREALEKRKTELATRELRKSVALYPKYAAAWCALGTALEAGNDFSSAREAYGNSLAADPKYIQPHVRLAAIALRENKWKEALEAAGRAIKLDPFSTPKAFLFHALANLKLGNLDAAEKSARELENRGAPRDPEVARLMQLILSLRESAVQRP